MAAKIDRNAIIGERVRFYRTTRELSLDKLCKMLQNPITGQQLARYETGQSRWPADLIINIADVLGVELRELTTHDGRARKNQTEPVNVEEWEAERYKRKILKLSESARRMVFGFIDDMKKI